MTDAGGKLVVQLADGVLEEHGLLDMLMSRINASPKGDVVDVVKGFLDLVEEGLIMSPAPRSSHWSDGAWVSWGANRSPDADRWFAMTRYSRFV